MPDSLTILAAIRDALKQGPDAADGYLATLADRDVVSAYNASEVESREADLLAGEMERRDLDD